MTDLPVSIKILPYLLVSISGDIWPIVYFGSPLPQIALRILWKYQQEYLWIGCLFFAISLLWFFSMFLWFWVSPWLVPWPALKQMKPWCSSVVGSLSSLAFYIKTDLLIGKVLFEWSACSTQPRSTLVSIIWLILLFSSFISIKHL